MNGSCLLDTNIIIALLSGDTSLQKHIQNTEEIFIPIIAVGELYFGARKSKRIKENIVRIDEYVASSAVLGCDTQTAQEYGLIKNRLRERGRPIPENDIWIAAIAKQHNLALVTRDEHFREVREISCKKW